MPRSDEPEPVWVERQPHAGSGLSPQEWRKRWDASEIRARETRREPQIVEQTGWGVIVWGTAGPRRVLVVPPGGSRRRAMAVARPRGTVPLHAVDVEFSLRGLIAATPAFVLSYVLLVAFGSIPWVFTVLIIAAPAAVVYYLADTWPKVLDWVDRHERYRDVPIQAGGPVQGPDSGVPVVEQLLRSLRNIDDLTEGDTTVAAKIRPAVHTEVWTCARDPIEALERVQRIESSTRELVTEKQRQDRIVDEPIRQAEARDQQAQREQLAHEQAAHLADSRAYVDAIVDDLDRETQVVRQANDDLRRRTDDPFDPSGNE